MKEQIYTIPVTDGFNEGGECAFCNMYKKLEDDAITYMLGASYMEDDIRMDTNKAGFCGKHYGDMYKSTNSLGLALMSQTHFQKIIKDLEILRDSKNAISKEKKSLFGGKTPQVKSKITEMLDEITDACYICERVERMFNRYFDTFFYLWTKGDDMKKLLEKSDGFCLEHFSVLLKMGEKVLKADEFLAFCDLLIPKQIENYKRIEGELDWYVKKFDYRYSDEPWKNSKDSIPRAILKLSSLKVDNGLN